MTEPKEPARSTEVANLRARSRMLKKIEGGEERVMLNVRRPRPNATCREPIEGMDENTLTVRLADAFGTTSPEFIDSMIGSLLTCLNAPHERAETRELNAALAVLDGAKPENEVEAMLLSQMVVTNDAAMKCLAQISNGATAELFGNLGVKLLRTFTAQTEALAKLRRKGEQTVRVVHVHPGAQAVVGDVHKGDVHNYTQGGGAMKETEEQPYGSGETAPGAGESKALPSPDATRDGMPITSDAERPVPTARRAVSRRPARKQKRP